MPDTFHWNDTTTVSRDGVTVERELEGREDGIIVTLDLEPDVDGPLDVAVRDEFPPELPAEQVGFNVEHEPDEGDLTLERAELRHTVADERARIVYAIRLAEPVSRVAFGDPVIEEVSVPDQAGSDAGAGTPARGDESPSGSPDADSSTEPTAEADQSDGPAEAVSGDGRGPAPDHDGGSDDAGDIDDAGVPDDDDARDSASPPDDATDRADASDGFDLDGGDRSGDADPDDVSSAIERAIEETESTGIGGEADGGEPADLAPDPGPDDQQPVDDAGAAQAADPAAGSPPSDGAPGGSANPGGGRPGPGGRTGHGGAAGPTGERGRAADEEVSRSVRLRLDWLSARVEEFATYAEALEEIIEREGTGPEILEALEDDIAEVDERLEEVRMDLDALQTEHAADVDDVSDRVDEVEERFEAARSELRSDVDAVRATVDDLAADVERVDHRAAENESAIEEVDENVESVESALDALEDRVGEHDEELTDVTEGVESVEAELSEFTESVEEMREDLESMQVDVQRLLRFREILSDVFGGPVQLATEEGEDADGPGGPDEESPGADGSLSTPSGPSDR